MSLRGVNCHSPFKHYMMFHGGCESGGNYGSVFNTTYNINCGGHGGFWGGFGYGLGNMLGGFLGNMFGGGMFGMSNMFSMGGLFGGFGGGWGNFWGGGNNFWGTPATYTTTPSSCTCGCKDKDSSHTGVHDADNILIENFRKEIDNLKDDASEELQKNLYNRIKAKLDKPEDSVYEKQNKEAYQNLLNSLKEKFPKTDFDKSADDKVNDDGDADGDDKVNDDGDADGDGKVDGDGDADGDGKVDGDGDADGDGKVDGDGDADGDGKVDGDGDGKVGGNTEKINNAGDFSDLPDYNTLTDEEKKAYANKCKYFASKMYPEDLRQFLNNPNLPSEVRVEIKRSFYKQGFTNATEDDLTADNLKKLIAVIDDSGKVGNFENVEVGSAVKKGDLWTIKMTKANNKEREIDYVQVKIVDGEIIFHGKQATQHYVLQKDNEGNLHLMQYKYHNGYGTADVHN